MPKVEDIISKLNGGNISQLWIYELVTITYLWIGCQYPKWHSIHLSANMNITGTIWTCSGSNIFSRTNDWNFEGDLTCNSKLG